MSSPFNPTTTISYEIPVDAKIRVTVFDIRGQEIVTLAEGYKSMGHYHLQWSGLNHAGQSVSTEIYFYRLITGDTQQTIKMLYLR